MLKYDLRHINEVIKKSPDDNPTTFLCFFQRERMPLILIQLNFLDYSTTTIEEYTIDVYVVDTLKQEVAIIPMEGLEVLVLHNLVLAENKTIYALGIKNGGIEGLEYILLNANSVLLATMEERLLSIQVGYLWID